LESRLGCQQKAHVHTTKSATTNAPLSWFEATEKSVATLESFPSSVGTIPASKYGGCGVVDATGTLRRTNKAVVIEAEALSQLGQFPQL
jgi:hypothetical protein